jgi:hypothetical protein
LLRIGAKVGAALAFAVTMRTEAVNADGEFTVEMMLAQRLVGRTPDELTWTLETAVQGVAARGVFAGMESRLRQLNGATVSKVTDALGQTKSLGVGTRVAAAAGTPDITFPEQAVSPGDSWTAEVENSGRKATIRYTFRRLETIGGRQILIVEGVYEPGQFISTVSPTVFRLDAADCTMVDARGSMQADMAGRVMRVTFTMTRQPSADRAKARRRQ